MRACRLAEWLYEAGIGEARAALVDDGAIVEARIERESEGPRVGAIVAARLIEPGKLILEAPGEPPATVTGLARSVALGAKLTVEIVRMALRERGRDKPARVRLAEPGASVAAGPDLRARITATGIPVTELRATGADRLEAAGWSELIDHIRTGRWPFDVGELWVDATPAMLLIDIDGDGDAMTLARAGARAAVHVIRCCGVGGSIGIDFPSVQGRAERLALDTLVDEWLPQPFERTGTNGFGLMQIVRRRERPSLIEQIRFDPLVTDAALLLRQAERSVGTGVLTLTARPAVAALIASQPAWPAMLQARTGRPVQIVADAQVKGSGHAQ